MVLGERIGLRVFGTPTPSVGAASAGVSRAEFEQLKNKVSQLETTVSMQKNTISKQESTIAQHESTIKNLISELNKTNSTVSRQESTIRNLTISLDNLASRAAMKSDLGIYVKSTELPGIMSRWAGSAEFSSIYSNYFNSNFDAKFSSPTYQMNNWWRTQWNSGWKELFPNGLDSWLNTWLNTSWLPSSKPTIQTWSKEALSGNFGTINTHLGMLSSSLSATQKQVESVSGRVDRLINGVRSIQLPDVASTQKKIEDFKRNIMDRTHQTFSPTMSLGGTGARPTVVTYGGKKGIIRQLISCLGGLAEATSRVDRIAMRNAVDDTERSVASSWDDGINSLFEGQMKLLDALKGLRNIQTKFNV